MGEPENLFKVGKLYIHTYQKSEMKNNHYFFQFVGIPKPIGGLPLFRKSKIRGCLYIKTKNNIIVHTVTLPCGTPRRGGFFSAQPFEGQDRDGEAAACPQMRSPLLTQHFLQSGQRSAQGRQGFYFEVPILAFRSWGLSRTQSPPSRQAFSS